VTQGNHNPTENEARQIVFGGVADRLPLLGSVDPVEANLVLPLIAIEDGDRVAVRVNI
jgi:hypothetical protein